MALTWPFASPLPSPSPFPRVQTADSNGNIYVHEDRATSPFCSVANPETALWRIGNRGFGATAQSAVPVARMDRNALYDVDDPSYREDCGNWEVTGGINVAELFNGWVPFWT